MALCFQSDSRTDLYEVNESRRANILGDLIERKYAEQLAKKDAKQAAAAPPTKDVEKGDLDSEQPAKPEDNSWKLSYAVFLAFQYEFWVAGCLKLIGDLATVTTPLVSQALLSFLTKSYLHHRFPDTTPPPPSQAYGWGLAVVMLVMQVIANICDAHFAYGALRTGVLFRTSVRSCPPSSNFGRLMCVAVDVVCSVPQKSAPVQQVSSCLQQR